VSGRELHIPGQGALPLDEKGYLLDWRDWTPAVARAMAATDGVELTDEHWLVLRLLRDYYEQYEIEPPMRALVRAVRERLGADQGSSRFLYRLFPDGPGTQGCRYAGLPRPVSCI
jgi:TusE/DsrC/DsvC family sulfur relay protein